MRTKHGGMRIQSISAAELVLAASACNAAGTNQSVPLTPAGSNVTGMRGTGAKAKDARVVYSGSGNLVLGNALDPSGKNLLVEIAIASSGSSNATTKIYSNDDNANNVQVLEM